HTNPLLELQSELDADDDGDGEPELETELDLPDDWAELFDDGPHSPADVPVRQEAGSWRQDVGDRHGPTLHARQIGQLRVSDLPPDARQAARLLAGNLDDNGWVSADAAELGRQYGWSPQLPAAAGPARQACDPAGVGAAGLRECLLLQWQ